jgi:transcriptional regulator with XRE-family HTH domain
MDIAGNNALGKYLRDRRARLDAASLGFACARRRTPGLRREEVAQRANISPTWYTWLEQGRGGAPSEPVLERIAQALVLTADEREHVFLLALGRAPNVRLQMHNAISPRLQRVLDAMDTSPAFIKSLTWDLVAWNPAAGAVFGYGEHGPGERNILRRIFCTAESRAANGDWHSVARFCVAAFRADAARAGPSTEIEMMVASLCAESAEFAAMWRDSDVRSFGDGVKHFRHPQAGVIAMEFSSFTVDGRPDLGMVVYHPMTDADAARVRALLAAAPIDRAAQGADNR